MLITRHFVFVHQLKTAGGFIKQLCRAHMPADWIVLDDLHHPPAREIPPKFRRLPVFGVMRNPWDWYVSWYHYTCSAAERLQGSSPGSPWVAMFDEGEASFRQVVIACCTGIPPSNGRSVWLDWIQEKGVDYYSLSCDAIFKTGFDREVEMLRFENVREQFIAFLQRHAIPVGDDFIRQVRTRPRDKVTPHAPYTSYYDRELRDLVGNTSRIATEYGYTFG
jgi:hypothetical protein